MLSQLLPHPTCSSCYSALQSPYLCLDCAFSGCFVDPSRRQPIKQSCIARHLLSSKHTLAFDIHTGSLYCSGCNNVIADPRFELIFHQERGRTAGRSVGPLLGDDKALDALCELPQNAISTRNPRGMHNLSATCFLSVILQSFLHNPILRNFFLADRHNAELCPTNGLEPCMACEMDKMFRDVSDDAQQDVSQLDTDPIALRLIHSSTRTMVRRLQPPHLLILGCPLHSCIPSGGLKNHRSSLKRDSRTLTSSSSLPSTLYTAASLIPTASPPLAKARYLNGRMRTTEKGRTRIKLETSSGATRPKREEKTVSHLTLCTSCATAWSTEPLPGSSNQT